MKTINSIFVIFLLLIFLPCLHVMATKITGKYQTGNIPFENTEPVSDFHTKNMNKIVFFKEKPVIGSEENMVATDFKLGDPVWAVAYLPEPIYKKGYHLHQKTGWGDKNSIHLVIFSDNQEITDFDRTYSRELTKDEKSKDYFVFQLFPEFNSNDISDPNLLKHFASCYSKLSSGKNSLEVRLYSNAPDDEFVRVNGFFTLDCTAKIDLADIEKKLDQRKLESEELPVAKMKDANLEAKILAAIQKYADNNGWMEEFSKVIITSDWFIVRNKLTGVVMAREIDAACCAKWPDGHCTYQTFVFRQDHDGSNFQSSLYRSATGGQKKISCEKIK